MKISMCFAAVALVLVSGCAGQMSALPGSGEAGHPASIPLRPLVDGLFTVDVEVGGETRRFLVDTGAGLTVVTPDVARAAGCTPFGRLTGFRSAGERLDGTRCTSVRMTLGGVEVSPEAGVIDLAGLGLQGLDGILSLQTLAESAVTFDFGARLLTIESRSSLTERIAGLREISVRPGRQAGGAALDYFLEVETKTGNLWLLLDSGNTQPVLLSPHALRQIGTEIPATEVQPVSLFVRGVGTIVVDASESERIYDGLLNAAFMATHTITFDLPNHRAWITRT
jgi:predicted aspartyl protease